MILFLGVDGGGTKTKITIINQLEKVIFENESGPSSIDTVDEETTLYNIIQAIKPFVTRYPFISFTGVFAGLGGIVFEEDIIATQNILRRLPHVNENTVITVRSDMVNALYSSKNFDRGISLICGTGMAAYGVNFGKTHKCGGWGFEEGELGSAYHLGVEAIRYCIRAYDNRYTIDDFAKAIAKSINLTKATDIIEITKSYFGKRTKTASLAPIVTKYANLGNDYAKNIIDEASKELALAVKGVYKTLKFDEVTLVIVGSLGNSSGYFKDKLHADIKQVSPKINIIKPLINPSFAAALAAKRQRGKI